MEVNKLNNYYKNHLQAELEAFNTEGYNLSIEWEMDFTKAKNEDNNIFLNDKTLYFVLSKLPSVSLEGLTIQSIMISCLCEQSAVASAMAILENYQKKVITSKVWFENVLMTQSYNSPNLSQNYLALDVSYGAEITMTGTLLFNENVNDIAELYMFNQRIDFINAIESFATTPSANSVVETTDYSTLTKTINDSCTYKLDIKFIDRIDLSICDLIRQIKVGNLSCNYPINVEIVESSGFRFTKQMILTSYSKNSGRVESPIMSISLMEANDILLGE